MTKKELLKALKDVPKNAELFMVDRQGGSVCYLPISIVESRTGFRDKHMGILCTYKGVGTTDEKVWVIT